MTARRTRQRMMLLLAAALFAAGIGLALDLAGAFKHQELRAIDKRFSIRGSHAANPGVAIVAFDEKTLKQAPLKEGQIDRGRYARVIGKLTAAGASAIAIAPSDLTFSEEGRSPKADNELIDATRASRKVVLGEPDVSPNGKTAVFGGGEGLSFSRATVGDTGWVDSATEPIYRVPFAPNRLPTIPLAAIRVATGHPARTPAGARDALIDYPSTIPRLSFVDVERGSFPASAVKGKIVFVGATAPFSITGATPTSAELPSVEIEAAATSTALDGFPLHLASGTLNALLAVLLGLIAPLLALWLRTWVALIGGLLAIAAFLIVNQLAFDSGTVLKVVPPLAAGALGLAGAVAVTAERSARVDRLLDRLSPEGGNQRTRRLRASLLLLSALVIFIVTLGADAGHALRRQELSSVNARFSVRGKQKPPNAVVVEINDQSLTGKGRQWPIKRTYHADVIRQLLKAGAKVIAYDVQFTEPSGDEAADNALYEAAVAAGPRLVLSTTEVGAGGQTSILGGGNAFARTKAIPGNGNYDNDVDGVIRRMPFKIDGLRAFALATADAAAGRTIQPPKGTTSAWIDYPGPPRTLPYLNFDDVISGHFNPALVRGKIVVVGATAPSLQDLHSTSTNTHVDYPGPEIQAVSAETALQGFPLRSAAGWLNVVLIAVMSAFTPLLALRVRRMVVTIVAGLVALGLLAVGAQLAFDGGTIITLAYPALAGVLALIATAAINGLTVAFEREQARDAFARFVPETVVDQVLQDADGVRLGGVRGEATVMFSDLRGFTSFSETLQPEVVIDALNRYLTAMSEAILDHGGTLVAYMGDGVMAVFGAPLHQSDHADRALEAAREMLERLEGFNQWLREEGLHDGFKMGIGLNSGPVMSGNVGSERRLEYTALGDTTNTAARLEGMTKGTPHQLYVADTTYRMLTRPPDDLVKVGEAEVRGRKAKVLLWSLLDGAAAEGAPKPAAESETVA